MRLATHLFFAVSRNQDGNTIFLSNNEKKGGGQIGC